MSDLTALGEWVRNVGFPIAVALILMFREDRCLKFLQERAETEDARFLELIKRVRRPRERRRR